MYPLFIDNYLQTFQYFDIWPIFKYSPYFALHFKVCISNKKFIALPSCTQDVNWTYIKRSKNAQDVNVLCMFNLLPLSRGGGRSRPLSRGSGNSLLKSCITGHPDVQIRSK